MSILKWTTCWSNQCHHDMLSLLCCLMSMCLQYHWLYNVMIEHTVSRVQLGCHMAALTASFTLVVALNTWPVPSVTFDCWCFYHVCIITTVSILSTPKTIRTIYLCPQVLCTVAWEKHKIICDKKQVHHPCAEHFSSHGSFELCADCRDLCKMRMIFTHTCMACSQHYSCISYVIPYSHSRIIGNWWSNSMLHPYSHAPYPPHQNRYSACFSNIQSNIRYTS